MTALCAEEAADDDEDVECVPEVNEATVVDLDDAGLTVGEVEVEVWEKLVRAAAGLRDFAQERLA